MKTFFKKVKVISSKDLAILTRKGEEAPLKGNYMLTNTGLHTGIWLRME